MEHLYTVLPMSTISGFDWPARSPDLNPLDFCVWGVLKEKVFKPRPQTVEELKDRIRFEVGRLDKSMLKRACQDVRFRCERVIIAEVSLSKMMTVKVQSEKSI